MRFFRADDLLWRKLSRFGEICSDFLLPPQCPVCRMRLEHNGPLCPGCWTEMELIIPPYCDRLGIPFALPARGKVVSPRAIANPPAFDRARAAVRYNEPARNLVHGIKYRDRHDFIGIMAQFMLRAGKDVLAGADMLVPVPLHWTRLWSRRFNQSAVLAKRIAGLSEVPVTLDGLIRVRRTPSQVGKTAGQRKRNVSGAFAVSSQLQSRISGSAIVLVDDVFTTGATVEACARSLKTAGARRADVLTFAQVADVIEGAI